MCTDKEKTPLFSRGEIDWRKTLERELVLFGDFVFLVEFLHATGSIQNLLFPGVKGMAEIADIYLHVPFCAAGFKGVSTGACDSRLVVFWMYSLFHLSCSLYELTII